MIATILNYAFAVGLALFCLWVAVNVGLMIYYSE